jgi:hydrogenase maturation factor
VPDIRVGEYVIVTGGMIVQRLSKEEAEQRLALFDQLLEVLDEA